MDDKEPEEYKKRLKELIESVEKNKDIPIGELQVREMREELLQLIKEKTQKDKSNMLRQL